MAVCRVEKNENYTVMSNYHLSDSRLSLKAVGLLSKMLSLPEDWDYTIRGLTHICREGRDAIQGAIVELEEAGYIQRQQRHDENGKFAGNEYVIHEAPLTDFPLTVKPLTENPPQLNTKITKYLNNTPPIVPPTGDEGEGKPKRKPKEKRKKPEHKDAPDWKPERFEAFWDSYPRGEGKQKAIQAWDKLQPDEDLLRTMALGLMRQLQSRDWIRGIGIPHASTWLNQRRWEDTGKKPIAPTAPSGWAKDEEVLG